MNVVPLLFIGYIVVVGMWIINHYHDKNRAYERAYKRGETPKW